MILETKFAISNIWKTVKFYGAKFQTPDTGPKNKLKKRCKGDRSSANVTPEAGLQAFTNCASFPFPDQLFQTEFGTSTTKNKRTDLRKESTPPDQQDDLVFTNSNEGLKANRSSTTSCKDCHREVSEKGAGVSASQNCDTKRDVALQQVQQLSDVSSQTEMNSAFFNPGLSIIKQRKVESNGDGTLAASMPEAFSSLEAQDSQVISESEWFSHKTLSPTRQQLKYTQQDVDMMIKEHEDRVRALLHKNARLESHLFSSTLERYEALEDAQNAEVEVSQLHFEIRAARTQNELDGIVLQDAIHGERKQRIIEIAEECNQAYKSILQEYEVLRQTRQQLSEKVADLQTINSSLVQLNKDLEIKYSKVKDQLSALQQEKQSLEAQVSANYQDAEMVTSLQDQLRKIEHHMEFVLADHAQKYLQWHQLSDEDPIFLLEPNEGKSLKQALEHLQTELKGEQHAKEKLQEVIEQREANLRRKDQEITNLNIRVAVLSATSTNCESATIQLLKSQIIDAKLANAKLQIANDKQREVYEGKISSQGQELDRLHENVIAAELKAASLTEKLQEKEAYVAETNDLRSQVELRAFGNDLDFLYSEKHRRNQQLEDICNFYFNLVNDLDAEIRLLKQEAGYKEGLLEDLEDRYLVKSLEHTRERMCRLALEWRFGEDIRASGRKVELDFTENELECRPGDVDTLKDVDYELYQPNADVFMRDSDDDSFAKVSNWEKHVREQREQEALKAFHHAVANAEEIAACGHEMFQTPTPDEDRLGRGLLSDAKREIAELADTYVGDI